MQKFNVAFIGCGAIVQKKHLPLCLEDEHLEVKMMFDTNKQAAVRCCELFGLSGVRVADQVEEVFKAKDIDVVFVATPNSTHASLSIRALESGKHVICEKPMAISSQDAQAMLAAAKANNRLLHISYQNRYTNQALYLKRIAQEGFFQDIYLTKAYALRRRAAPTWGVMTNQALSGGGPLVDIGSHALDLAMWLTDNFAPKYVVGTVYDKLAKRGSEANFWGNWDVEKFTVEDSAFGFVVMENGMTLTIDASYALNIPEEFEASVDIYGTEGGAQLRRGEEVHLIHEVGGQMCITRNHLQMTERSLTPSNLTQTPSSREHKAFMQCLLSGDYSNETAKQASVVVKITEGIYKSAREGGPVYF